ncbi:MAG: hypothetical protein A2W63_05585 [Deltaproteobacteria bacterium RIFCSPLOWO2_02_44_9]|nr:MAG: hypothetical protein A2W63_05585 [Deltaproteobacteria bacterium RIFCSPLOWO2_02_44_9]
MFGIGTTELIIILVIILIIFGVGKLPSIGTGIGQAIKNFKKATTDTDTDTATHREELKSTTSAKSEEPSKKV